MGHKSKPDRWSEVRHGFRSAGIILLAMLWLGFIIHGWVTIGSSPGLFAPASRSGWVSLALAGGMAVAIAEKFLKVFPGLCAYGAINGLLAIWNGHLRASSSRPITRSSAAIMTLLMVASVAAAMTLKARKATVFDRVIVSMRTLPTCGNSTKANHWRRASCWTPISSFAG